MNLVPVLLSFFWRLENLSAFVALGVRTFGSNVVTTTVLTFDLCLGTKLVR